MNMKESPNSLALHDDFSEEVRLSMVSSVTTLRGELPSFHRAGREEQAQPCVQDELSAAVWLWPQYSSPQRQSLLVLRFVYSLCPSVLVL